MKKGYGGRRRRELIDSESASDNEEVISTNLGAESKVRSQQDGEIENAATNVSRKPEKEKEEYDKLREASRRSYLEKRHLSKLLDLENEINSLEEKKKKRKLSRHEQDDYEYKNKVYALLKEREEHGSLMEQDNYQIIDDYVTAEGKLDKKRKIETLRSKEKYDDSEDIVKQRNKNHQYEHLWEIDQLRKSQIAGVSALDEIQLADGGEYDFVFDETQMVDFDDDEALEGDDVEHSDDANADVDYSSIRKSIEDVRKSLPAYRFRDQFLNEIEKNQILIVVGETGSGKTTQLPQYLNEKGYTKGSDGKQLLIACTQPRRVAATSVAKRVSEEMNVDLGAEVGYSVRFEDMTSDKTKIKYLTDGMLLREFLSDPKLSSYGAVMIDEAHERTISTEIILSLLKDLCKVRKDLKLIIASATINAEKFSKYFDNAPIFNIPGRRFPVDIHYTKNPEANYIQAAITTVFQIHISQPLPGDILVFLTGQDEIETMQESLQDACHKFGRLIKPLVICSIYANMPIELQKTIFEPTPPDSRKVVLATNIAETSITIDGISYVIDPGYVKENVFNPVTAMDSLVVVPCSRASANQRAGRAGRVGPGKCFRLYTKWSFYNEILANPTPEILRVNLTTVVLLLLSLGITDLIHFDFIDPPSTDSLIKSLELLYALGALNSKGELTRTGRKMAEFPIDVKVAKCLLASSSYGVSEEILTIISMLGESAMLFYRPKDKKEQADKSKETFHVPEGDHLTLLNIWNQWYETGYSVQWCQDKFIQYRSLKRAREVKKQLKKLCVRNGIEITSSDDINKDLMIRKAITAGFFPNIARLSKTGDSYRTLKKNHTVHIHPSSVIYAVKPPPKLVLYHELVLTSKEFMRSCMLIEHKWLEELATHYYSTSELELIQVKPKRA